MVPLKACPSMLRRCGHEQSSFTDLFEGAATSAIATAKACVAALAGAIAVRAVRAMEDEATTTSSPLLGNTAPFPLTLVSLIISYADAKEVNAFIRAAPSYQLTIAPHVWLSTLCRRYGRKNAAWLSRCPPQRRRQIFDWLANATVPRLSQHCMPPFETPHNSHTLVALPKVSWPYSANKTQVAGVMLLFGGVCDRALETVAETFNITLRGNIQANDELEASLEPLDAPQTPTARVGHTAVWMQDLDSLAVYGGMCSNDDADNTALGSIWLLEQVRTVPHQSTWRWLQVKAAMQAPKARSHFASCALSGSSFFVHGGQSCQPEDEVLDDAWVCWIDDGFDEAGDCAIPGCCCCRLSQASAGGQPAPLSKQLSEQLAQQVSHSYQNLSPQVAITALDSEFSESSGIVMPNMNGDLQTVARWRRIEADGEPPPQCRGHSATCSPAGIIIHGMWNGAASTHCLGPIYVLERLLDSASESSRNRAHYTRLQSSFLTCHREWATLHTALRQPALLGGCDSNDQRSRAWHASCKLPVGKDSCPTIVVFGGRDHNGTTCGDLLLISWTSTKSPGLLS